MQREDRPDSETRAVVTAVSRSDAHTFSKQRAARIRLCAGLGVEGDAHAGATVKHRSRVRANPSAPNLRQVHLMHAELHDALREAGFEVGAGQLGENVTTRGLALLDLPQGSRLHIGASAVLELTGLRNPCKQIDAFQPGLMAAVLGRDVDGKLVRKAGVMAVVLRDGEVTEGDVIRVALPDGPHRALEPV